MMEAFGWTHLERIPENKDAISKEDNFYITSGGQEVLSFWMEPLVSYGFLGYLFVFNVPLFDSPNLDIGKNNAATT